MPDLGRIPTADANGRIYDELLPTRLQASAILETVQDAVGGMVKAGTNVTTVYDNTAGTITISAAGGGTTGVTDPEVVRDTVAAALSGSGNVQVTVNDAADSITISLTGLIPTTNLNMPAIAAHSVLANTYVSAIDYGVLQSRVAFLESVLGTGGSSTGNYDSVILADNPVGYWPLASTSSSGSDKTANNHPATFTGSPTLSSMPNGDPAVVFNGTSTYATVPNFAGLSVPTTGQLTVEMWIRPDVINFPHTETSGDGPIVYPLVKGTTYGASGDQEWLLRMYNHDNLDGTISARPNRISAYVFNPAGALGAGSYVQETVTPGQWIFITAVFDTVNKGSDGWGTTRIYKNGVLKDTDTMGGDYDITPVAGSAPLHIGARPEGSASYFKGAIAKLAVYPTALTPQKISAHYQAMTGTTVTVTNTAPTAAFTSAATNLSVAFSAAGSADPDGSIASYAWTFGDGATGTGATPTHVYSAAGTYTVTLTVTDDDGATSSISHSVSVVASESVQFVRNVGTAQNTTTGTALAVPVAATIPTGHTLVLSLAHDYTSGGPTVTDSKGNTWTRHRTSTTTSLDMRASVFAAPVTTQLVSGDTITVTLSSSVAAKAAVVGEFLGLQSAPFDVYADSTGTGTVAQGGSSGGVNGVAPTTSHSLIVGTLAVRGPATETFTEAAGFTSTGRVGTTTNVTVAQGWKAVQSTATVNYNPTLGTSEEWIDIAAVFKAS